MVDEKLIISEIETRINDLQRSIVPNTQQLARTVFTSMIACYKGIIKYIKGVSIENIDSSEETNNILHGWVSRDKNNQLWLHNCENEPEEINGEWFGNENDIPIDNSLFSLLNTDNRPIKVDIILKRR